ncbi:MAG: MFS transporter [Treponema sp.]|jgi:PPP family 3-phenylpropionic acid transporter|nr:MFS transporter [Treponema sp.]
MRIENRFVSFYVFSFMFYAIVTPYIAVLIRDLGYSSFWVGILLGVCEVAGIAGPFVFGFWADKTGNYRPALIVSFVVPALVVFPLIFWVNPLLSAVFLFLLTFGLRAIVSLVDAVTTIQIGPSGNYGRIRVWGSIAFIFMTLFFHWTPFMKPDNAWSIGLWSFLLINLSFIPIFITPGAFLKTSTVIQTEEKPKEKTVPVSLFYVFCGFSIILLSRFAITAVYSYISLYLIEVVHWDAVGLVFAIAAMAEVPFMFLSRALILRFGALSLLALSAAGVCLRLLILAFLPFKGWIIISSLLHSVCFGLYHPAAIHFISSVFPVEKRGRGMSVYMITGSGLPSLFGIVAGGAIIEASGFKSLFIIYAVIAGAAVIIYCLYILKCFIFNKKNCGAIS